MIGVLATGEVTASSVITELVTIMGSVVSELTKAPLCYFFYAGLACCAIGIFARLKNTAQH